MYLNKHVRTHVLYTHIYILVHTIYTQYALKYTHNIHTHTHFHYTLSLHTLKYTQVVVGIVQASLLWMHSPQLVDMILWEQIYASLQYHLVCVFSVCVVYSVCCVLCV